MARTCGDGYRAMLYQEVYVCNVGNLYLSKDKDERAAAIDVLAQSILLFLTAARRLRSFRRQAAMSSNNTYHIYVHGDGENKPSVVSGGGGNVTGTEQTQQPSKTEQGAVNAVKGMVSFAAVRGFANNLISYEISQDSSITVSLFVLGKDPFYLLFDQRILILSPSLYMVVVGASRQLRQRQQPFQRISLP